MTESSAVTRALNFLMAQIEECRARETTRLPVQSVMASMAGVAPATMRKAVRTLAANGILSVSHGKGTRIVAHAPDNSTEETPAPTTISNRLRQRILCDLQEGFFLHGYDSPTIKVMIRRYGVSRNTLRKSLQWFEQQNLLERNGTRYRGRGSARYGGSMSIHLIAAADGAGHIEFLTPRTRKLINAIESECLQQGIGVILLPFNYYQGALLRPLQTSAGQAGAAGAIILTTSISAEAISSMTGERALLRRPTALYDETGECTATRQNVRIFCAAGASRAGEDVGRFLISRGHRRIAYISHAHESAASANRLQGLRRACDTAASPGSVSAFTETARHDPHHQTETDGAIHAVTDEVRRQFARTRCAGAPTDHIVTEIGGKMGGVFALDAAIKILNPLLEKAILDPAITAWVLYNDMGATAANAFLKQHGRDVPGDVSIVGFDDSDDAFFHDLTSYNFNDTGAARAMIAHVLSPRHELLSTGRGKPLVIGGFVNRRGSVRER